MKSAYKQTVVSNDISSGSGSKPFVVLSAGSSVNNYNDNNAAISLDIYASIHAFTPQHKITQIAIRIKLLVCTIISQN